MNIVSVSWGDHLSFGEGDGRLETPDALARRLRAWRDELGAGALLWRMLRTRVPGRFSAGRGYRHPSWTAASQVAWDDFDMVPRLARGHGLEPWLYVSVFDEGYPLAPLRARRLSYHNAMHGRHTAWQSHLTRDHPEWVVADRLGRRQWGVVCLAYDAARRALIDRWTGLLRGTRFAGLFLCLRSQSRPAAHADQFGFNEPVRDAFRARYGQDPGHEAFDIQSWRDLLGESLTRLLEEARAALAPLAFKLAVGVPRGEVLGPPLGNTTLAWKTWCDRRLVDALVIDQDSSRCPSMWHDLWPMHRGTGYLQNYIDGSGLPPLEQHVARTYGPVALTTGVRLYAARQWVTRSAETERRLQAIRGLAGLVFSSFRHDNPAALARGDWRAGRLARRAEGH